MAERTDFNGSNMPKYPKSPCSFQKTGCSFHSFEPILSKQAKKKSPENPIVYCLRGPRKVSRLFGEKEEQRRERGMIFTKKSSQAIHSL